jgi:hypothetical protein
MWKVDMYLSRKNYDVNAVCILFINTCALSGRVTSEQLNKFTILSPKNTRADVCLKFVYLHPELEKLEAECSSSRP